MGKFIGFCLPLCRSCISFRDHCDPDVSFEREHVLVFDEDGRRSRRGEEGKEVLEISELWRGAFQVQMDHATSRYVSGNNRNLRNKNYFNNKTVNTNEHKL